MIIVNLDIMMARRKISLGELAEKIDITPANLSILKTGKAKAVRFSTLQGIGLPAGRYTGVCGGRRKVNRWYIWTEEQKNTLLYRIVIRVCVLLFFCPKQQQSAQLLALFALNASAYIRICFTIESNPLLRVGERCSFNPILSIK